MIERRGNVGLRANWLVRCECATELEASSYDLDRWGDEATCKSKIVMHRMRDVVDGIGNCSVCGEGVSAVWHKNMNRWLCALARADARMQYQHGISMRQWMEAFEEQGKACAICRATEPGSERGWHTDHDHDCCESTPTCGKCFRGVLCSGCNVGIGHLKNDCAILAAACDYLRRTP